jgi:hypothetical protein
MAVGPHEPEGHDRPENLSEYEEKTLALHGLFHQLFYREAFAILGNLDYNF